MTFERLRAADALAMVAALVLLFTMAMDWYTSPVGREARRIESFSQPQGALGGEVERQAQKDASDVAEGQERNAWQPNSAVDSLILAGLLASFILAIGAGFLRAAGRRFPPPLTPSFVCALVAGLTGLLVALRWVVASGSDSTTSVQSGLPLSLVVLGGLALAASVAYRAEDEGRAWKELPRDRDGSPSDDTPAAAGRGG
ncbi:MAG: hypothetical protein WKF40_04605 [Thermoleophilaceae bacterium]